jgi:tetratricopeptide (TPR) repeat protein
MEALIKEENPLFARTLSPFMHHFSQGGSMTFRKLVALFLALTLLAGCAGARKRSAEAYRKASALVLEGKKKEALVYYKKAIELYPKNVAAHQKYQDFRIAAGEREQVQREYKEKMEANPKDAIYLYLYGRLLPYDEGKEYFKKCVAMKAKCAWGYYGLGCALQREGKYTDAIDEFQRALELEDTIADAHLQLGRAYAMTGKLSPAQEEFRKVIDMEPENAEGYFYLGNFCLIEGNVNEAALNYERSLKLDPASSKTINAMGKVYLLRGKTSEAIANFEKVLTMTPTEARAYMNIARALYLDDRTAEAMKAFKKSQMLDGKMLETHYLLALAYMDEMRWRDAEYELSSVERTRKNYPGIHKARALIDLARGSDSEAEKELALEQKINRNDPEVYYIKGQILFRRFQVLKAEEQFKNALAVDSRYYPAYLGMGQIEEYFKEYVRAIRVYEEALVLFPDDAEIMYRMGACYSLHGDEKPAVQYFRKAFEFGMDDWGRIDKDMAIQGLKYLPEVSQMLQKYHKSGQKSIHKHSALLSTQDLIYNQLTMAYKRM